MKKLLNIILVAGILGAVSGCQKSFLDLTPPSNLTDAVFFKQPSDFQAYSTNFYYQLLGWWSLYGNNSNWDFMDGSSDIAAYAGSANTIPLGKGQIVIQTSDSRWDNNYGYIRACNILLAKAQSYIGSGDISQYVGEAYFFRANAYLSLLKFYGGVPIVTTVPDVNSAVLQAPRNSRYEVVALILSDLTNAIAKLPTEQNIPASDKGRISKWGAEALKAKVELYEATWEKYVGNTTDGDGKTTGGGTTGLDAGNVTKYLTDVVALTQDVMTNGGYSLWNQNALSPVNESYYWLFNLEDGGSNPYGLTKASNNEFIIYSVYDFTLRQSYAQPSHILSTCPMNRKLADMFLCTDGLPPSKSPLFQGYHHAGDEFQNRDYRMLCYADGEGSIATPGSVALVYGLSGYNNWKFVVRGYGTPSQYRSNNAEAYNYPLLRLPEVYLMYAEANFELNGSITDAQLNQSINLIRARAGIAPLTNALVSSNGLDMLGEIRRERAVELFMEGDRFDDLKRWGILEASLNPSRCGMVVGDGTTYSTDFKDAMGAPTALYKPSSYTFPEETASTAAGNLNCVVLDTYKNHSVTRTHYLWPLPQNQINLNTHLLQNPGY